MATKGESGFNTWYAWALSKGVVTGARHNAVGVILVDSGQHAPYAMSVSASTAHVGRQASGTVKILGSNGKPAVGRGITITSAQGRILTVNGVAGAAGPHHGNRRRVHLPAEHHRPDHLHGHPRL